MTGWRSLDRGLRFALLATLAVLLAHAFFYRFLCDDAFISFRYAHNLATGRGLVFNPGFERVEGYTNFLWVILLAAFDAAGAKPELAAPVLSVLLTVALWGLVAAAAWRLIPDTRWRPAILLPTAWLAVTRSVAVWSTSGLETRLFEVLVVAAVFRLVEDVAALCEGRRRAPVAALLFALAALTRPDGMLVGVAAMAAAAGVLVARRRARLADLAPQALVFGAIVGAHLLFRHAYYGDWVPNTYYAKVGGRSWWGMGAVYAACFALEYSAWTWIPLLVAGAQGFVKDRRAEVPLLFSAAVLPHVLYVVSIGGDHFEFRPLDLDFPFLFIVMARGAAALAEAVLPRWSVASYALAVAVGLVAIPWQSHREFPKDYAGGFPGQSATRGEGLHFLDPARDPVYRWPGLRVLAEAHRNLLRSMTERLVGVRQEEHALFLELVVPEGRRLGALVAAGVLPQDTHLAISAVGAIPYYSNLRVLDRLGLTDAVVAKSAPGEFRIMAHDKHATLEYAASRGVDLWSEHPVLPLVRIDDDSLVWTLDAARAAGTPVYFAAMGEGEYLLAQLPQGIDKAASRFPRLAFHAATDESAYAALLDGVIEARTLQLKSEPTSRDARVALGVALSSRSRDDEALPIFRGLAAENDADGWYNLGVILLRRGEFLEAADAYRKALQLDASIAAARHNLGLALLRAGRVDEAIAELREAVRREPDSQGAAYTLGVALLVAGDTRGAGEFARRLEAAGTPEGTALAAKLRGAGAGTAPPERAP